MFGSPNMINADLQRYLDLTAEDVMAAFAKYIKDQPGVILSYLPNEETAKANDNEFQRQTEGENPFPTTDYSGLSYVKPSSDNFDRSIKPKPGPSPLVKVPDFWEDRLDNGIEVIGAESNEIPTVAIQLTLNGGHRFDANDPQKSGLAQLTAAMMNESTENYTAEEMQEELRKIGSSINISAGNASTTISINTLKKNLKRTLELAEEKLMRPGFVQVDFDRIKKQQTEGIIANQKVPASMATQVYNKLLYGDDHIYSVPASGMEETVEQISLEDIRSFYNKYYSANTGELVVVGDVEHEEVMKALAFVNNIKNKNVEEPEMPTTPAPSSTKIYFVDKPEAPQSEIRIGYLTDMPYDAMGNYFKSYLMNYPLGGAFNSRININLREDKGWTYGARSGFSSTDEPGPFTASAGVIASATDSAVFEFMKEIKEYGKNGIEDDELAFMRNSIGQRDARSYETPGQKAGFLRRIIHYDLDRTYVDEQTEIIQSISKNEINALAKRYLDEANFYVVVVGDAATNLENVKKLGYDVVELDERGNKKE